MKIVSSRIDPIIELIKGKKVLDIGCVGLGGTDTYGGINWIHGKMVKVAKKCVGLDIQKEEVEKLREKGFDTRIQNIEEPFDLGEKFDVVVAEEVIEHLSNLGIFLDNIKKHLDVGGLFIISTPNPHGYEFFLSILLLGRTLANPRHTHWQSADTLKHLLESNGFELIHCFFVEGKSPIFMRKVIQYLFSWLPQRFARDGIYIAKKKAEDI